MFIKWCGLIPELFKHMHLYLVMTKVVSIFCRYQPGLGPAGFGAKDYMFSPQWATLWTEKCTKFWRRNNTENWRDQSKVMQQIYGWEEDKAQVCGTNSQFENSLDSHWVTGYVRNISLETIKEKGWQKYFVSFVVSSVEVQPW